MWRSEPSMSTTVLSKSGSDGILFHRLPDDLFERGHTVLHLAQPALPERDHPLVDRLAAELRARRADENQLAQLLADFHHLVEADAALVAGLRAPLTPFAPHRRHGVRIVGVVASLYQRRRRRRVGLLAVRAHLANQALRANQV